MLLFDNQHICSHEVTIIPFMEFSYIEKQGIKFVERKGLNKEDVGWVTFE